MSDHARIAAAEAISEALSDLLQIDPHEQWSFFRRLADTVIDTYEREIWEPIGDARIGSTVLVKRKGDDSPPSSIIIRREHLQMDWLIFRDHPTCPGDSS